MMRMEHLQLPNTWIFSMHMLMGWYVIMHREKLDLGWGLSAYMYCIF